MKKTTKKTYEEVKHYIEVESESGCKLLSTEYIKSKEKLSIQCKCGKPFEKTLTDFRKSKGRMMCRDCMKVLNLTGKNRTLKYEDVKHFIEVESNSGCKLISTEYTRNSHKLDAECACGKLFNPSFLSFKRGQRQCNDCGQELRVKDRRHSFGKVKEIIELAGYKLISKEYLRAIDNLTIKDKDGYYYSSQLFNIKNGKKPHKVHTNNPFTIQNIKLWCKLENKPFELLSDTYVNAEEKLKWRCLREKCGEIFEMEWSRINSKGQECFYCNKLIVGLSNCLATLNPELAKEWHPTKNGNLTPYDVTDINSTEQVWWQCQKEHEWQIDVGQRTYFNSQCPYCTHKLPSEDYNLLVINPKLCEEWDYEKNVKRPEEVVPGSARYVHWKCRECGHKWEARINHRNNDGGCPECLIGWGEKQLKVMCDKYNSPYTPQLRLADCRDKLPLPFDVAVFKDESKTQLRVILEYDGKQHFEPVRFGDISQERAEEVFILTQYHDKIKNDYCIENNIPLLRIPYWERLNIEEILIDVLINGNIDHKYFVR